MDIDYLIEEVFLHWIDRARAEIADEIVEESFAVIGAHLGTPSGHLV